MHNPKIKLTKSAVERLTQKKIIALVREGEAGPFKSMDNFVQDIKAQWRENMRSIDSVQKIKTK